MGVDQETIIHVGTYKIWNGRSGVIDSALQGMDQANLNLEVFQDTKVVDGIHARISAGYQVFATKIPIRHLEEVVVFYSDSPHFQVEALQPHGQNVLRFHVVLRGRS